MPPPDHAAEQARIRHRKWQFFLLVAALIAFGMMLIFVFIPGYFMRQAQDDDTGTPVHFQRRVPVLPRR